MTKTLTALAIALSVFVSTSAQADLVEADWQVNGDNLAVLDTDTGLEWLDFTETDQYTLSGITTAIANDLDEWRLATQNEVSDLFNKLFPSAPNINSPGTFYDTAGSGSLMSEIGNFVSLFNSTPTNGDILHYGLYEANSSGVLLTGALYDPSFGGSARLFNEYNGSGFIYSNDTSFSYYLVRNTTASNPVVPDTPDANDVPLNLGIGTLAMLSLISIRRRQK